MWNLQPLHIFSFSLRRRVESIICPYCRKDFGYSETIIAEQNLDDADGTHFRTEVTRICPNCSRALIYLRYFMDNERRIPSEEFLQWPSISPPNCPHTDDDGVRTDFLEAVEVFPWSRRAAAALARSCIQKMIWTRTDIDAPTFHEELEQLAQELWPRLGSKVPPEGSLPDYLESLATMLEEVAGCPAGEIHDIGREEDAAFTIRVAQRLMEHFRILDDGELPETGIWNKC